ncbi:MAG TPA: hypothetical protein VGS58_08905, partial [Candidatus Sulfopaludibacter sp.]|nr:hypothetical protein [Candidatus Sulfopaludibacter sp.]
APAGGGPALPLIASELPDSSPQYSPDGKHLAFVSLRSGSNGIWVAGADGANEHLVFDGKGMPVGSESWSPDGKQLAFEWHPAANAEIHVVAAGGGKSRPVVADAFNNRVPVWSCDGSYLYFSTNRTGRPEIFRVAESGGPVTQITTSGVPYARVGPDCNQLYYMTGGKPGAETRELWRADMRDGLLGAPQLVLPQLWPQDWNNWVAEASGLYFMHRQKGQDPAIQYLDFQTHKVRTVHDLQRPTAWGGGMAIAPDSKALLFTQVDRDGTSLFVQ